MKRHQPTAVVIYENVRAVVAAAAHVSSLASSMGRFNAMHPGHRPIDIDRRHCHRNGEVTEYWPIHLPVPLDRVPPHVGDRVSRRCYQNVVRRTGPDLSMA